MIKNPRVTKGIALFFLVQFCVQVLAPSISYALTSGPSQPEFSSFEPVSASNMVDDFTGDFMYNIPLLEVPGPHGGSYPVTLSYHSGTTPEEEASWVGYGWTINTGAINRNVRGIPDDFKNDDVIFHNKTKTNYTITAGFGLNVTPEFFSFDKQFFSLGLNSTYRYNNYRGFTTLKNIGIALGRGVFNMGYTVSEGEGSYSLNVNPAALLNYMKKEGDKESSGSAQKEKSSSSAGKQYFLKAASKSLSYLQAGSGSTYGIFTYNQAVLPTQVSPYEGKSFNVSGAINVDPAVVPVGFGANMVGSYTYQDNIAVSNAKGYGYLYSSSATTNDVMDYHTDNENPFDKQDLFLGVPFNDADNFVVTGEGISGAFRLYNKNIGHFGQRHVKSNLTFFNTGVEFAVGTNFGAGGDTGIGTYSMDAADWKRDISSFLSPTATLVDEPIFARFNNDLAGSVGDNFNDKPDRFAIGPGSDSSPTPLASQNFSYDLTANGRNGRSSYIGYHTNAEILSNPYRAYSQRSELTTMARRSVNGDRIGELAVINEDGLKYIYGLPVHSKDEKNLSYGLKGVAETKFEANRIVYDWREDEMKVGQHKPGEYAHSYLLTEIHTADYLDVSSTPNGPTSDDFGGYVRFGYKKIFGDASEKNKWYGWRIPYNGAGYQRNQLSEPKDDIATVVSGLKEIYYLKTIETKTHVAVFVFSDRNDGLGAPADAKNKGATTSDKLKKLDRIDLYSLSQLSSTSSPARDATGNISVSSVHKPIKTVHFKYSTDELMPGAPNGVDGRLTLEKVYFEYNGISQVKISPYIFKYAYPTNKASDPEANRVRYENYSHLENFGETVRAQSAWTGLNPENPSYSPFNVDAWGNYQANGAGRYADMRPWVDQRMRPNTDFDPAAWQLKRIKLPTGGEIHIQYEQDDYYYVQNENAHIMTRLLTPALGGADNPESRFDVDWRDLGLRDDDPNLTLKLLDLKATIEKLYVGSGAPKMYFKFLYQLSNTGAGADTQTCNAEFISGYAKVKLVDLTGTKLTIEFENPSGGANSEYLPKTKCRQYVLSNVVGKVGTASICDRSAEPIPNNGNPAAIAMAFLSAAPTLLNMTGVMYCEKLNESLSYLRLPAINSKKGGGLRVKRLLMYDNSIDGPVVYGNEYAYQTEENGKIISSGVATNEPGGIREENILVKDIPKKDQTWYNRLVVGKDKEEYEGPPGESIYPGPSVGYSKVAVTNIHTGKTNAGFSLKEFYTAKDFPITWDKTDINHRSNPVLRMGLIVNMFVNEQWATQGFSYVLNSMHGQLKRSASYSGNYVLGLDLRNTIPVSEQIFEFFKPGEEIPIMSKLYGKVTKKAIGREVDVTLSQKSVTETSFDGNMESDFTLGLAGIIPIPFVTGMISLTENKAFLKTHVTSKVVRYPAIVKKITTYQDGIYHVEENAAFDEYTGKPVAIKSFDEFTGAYLAQQIPAAWEYNNFKPAAISENRVTKEDANFQVTLAAQDVYKSRFKLVFSGLDGCKRLSELVTGDLLEFNNGNLFHVEEINYAGDYAQLVRAKPYKSGLTEGTGVNDFRILRTGKNNQLSQKAGNIVFHNVDKNAIDPFLYEIPDAERFGTNDFVDQLNAKYAAINSTSNFVLAGPFAGMNMSAYQDLMPCCAADWDNATISNVSFRLEMDGTQKTLILVEFDIDCKTSACGTQTVKIKN